MRALRIGPQFYISAADIMHIQSFPSRPAERTRQNAAANGFYHDACFGRKTLSLVVCRNGWVYGSPLQPHALVSRPLVSAPVRAAARGAGRRQLRAQEEQEEDEQSQEESTLGPDVLEPDGAFAVSATVSASLDTSASFDGEAQPSTAAPKRGLFPFRKSR